MIDRPNYLEKLSKAFRRSPVTAMLGPRQCGKTTLARLFGSDRQTEYLDLESQPDVQRLHNPELYLGSLEGLVILDEIQNMPSLFNALRVLVDRPENRAHFLILGSAAPDLIKNVSETLAGRVEFIELSGFDIGETGADTWQPLWLRGGFPRSFLADSDEDSLAWREGFIKTYLERDIPPTGNHHPIDSNEAVLDDAGALSWSTLECFGACPLNGPYGQNRSFLSGYSDGYFYGSPTPALA